MLWSSGDSEDCYLDGNILRSGWSVVEKQIDILTSYEIYNRSRIIILHVEATTTYS